MYLIEVANGTRHKVKIELVEAQDYKLITKGRYYFNWKNEKNNDVYKLVLNEEIIGLMTLLNYVDEKRIEINLLAVSKENRGENKTYDRIAGLLIAFTCRIAKKEYGIEACVSLVPKTELKPYYITEYGMIDAGWQVFVEGISLLNILKKYEL